MLLLAYIAATPYCYAALSSYWDAYAITLMPFTLIFIFASAITYITLMLRFHMLAIDGYAIDIVIAIAATRYYDWGDYEIALRTADTLAELDAIKYATYLRLTPLMVSLLATPLRQRYYWCWCCCHTDKFFTRHTDACFRHYYIVTKIDYFTLRWWREEDCEGCCYVKRCYAFTRHIYATPLRH